MGFSVDGNSGSATFYANLNQQKVENSLNRMASGLKLNSAADDAASMAIANNLGSQVREAGQSIMNANDQIGMIQIADGAMQGVNKNMEQIRDLTLRASSPIMNAQNKVAIQKEITALSESNAQMINAASYNGISLLDGSSGSLADASAYTGGAIDVTGSMSLEENLESIDNSMAGIGSILSDLGASQNQLVSDINNTSVFQVNAAAAESNLRDLDFAQESANFNRQNLQAQVGAFVQAQSNAVEQNVARLFQ